MREFLILQKRLFPAYFQCQLGLVALTAVTRPPYGLASFAGCVGDAVPLVLVGVTGALNYWVFGPRTTRDAFVRRAVFGRSLLHRAWRVCADGVDGAESTADEEKVTRAKKAFARNHAMSIHLNAISMVATVWYAFSMTSSLFSMSM